MEIGVINSIGDSTTPDSEITVTLSIIFFQLTRIGPPDNYPRDRCRTGKGSEAERSLLKGGPVHSGIYPPGKVSTFPGNALETPLFHHLWKGPKRKASGQDSHN